MTAPPAATPTASPAPGARDRRAELVRVRFPGRDVDAAIGPVRVDDRGEREVPEDVHTVGWYRFGPAPGSTTGSGVLSGHVDDRVQGRGAFHRPGELEPGDAVEVVLADGTTVAHRVAPVERTGKDRPAVERIVGRSGPRRLALVTCEGGSDRVVRSRRENVVATAQPVTAPG